MDDFLAAMKRPEANMHVRPEALREACQLAGRQDAKLAAASHAAVAGLESLGVAERVEQLIAICRALAVPELREAWPHVLRSILEAQPSEVAERLEFVRPIADALETGEVGSLDPLPPEQREFALEVLRRFDADDEEDTRAPVDSDG